MRFPDAGRNADELLRELAARKLNDLPWAEGRVFAYVYDAGPEAMRLIGEALRMYMTENGLDPTSFPSVFELERDVIAMALDLMSAPEGAVGSFTSGGTESILLSVKTARDFARAERPHIERPALVLPETAHPAFFKACAYFDVRPVRIPVDASTLRASPSAMEAAIDAETIMLVGSAPSYAHGVVDPIPEIAAIAQRRGLLMHVDCCVGGMYLPFAKPLGVDLPSFDLSTPGVTQLSMDFHKWGYAAKGASAILYKDAAIRRHQIFAWSGWTGYTVINPTMLSTRSGGPLAAAWAIINHLGMQGYLALVKRTQEASERIRAGIREIDGLRILGDPRTNLFAFAADGFDIFAVAEEMKARRWYVQPQLGFGPSPPNIHLSVGASNAPNVDALIADLRECVEAVRRAPRTLNSEQIAGLLPRRDESAAQTIERLSAAIGSDGGALPARMDGLNNLLQHMPSEQRDALFIEFTNRLYAPRC